ncbi:hypothetical protein [Paenirhodobacter populi]|uniref:hypothetical protein n=1 Tax=Paenirhodobacter populi TaxID=2306993 RepID=UPI0037448D52
MYRYTTEERGVQVRRYWINECQTCPLQSRCTTGTERRIKRQFTDQIGDARVFGAIHRPVMNLVHVGMIVRHEKHSCITVSYALGSAARFLCSAVGRPVQLSWSSS